MLMSMTGFGRAQEECASGLVEAQIRSVNHRFLKVSTHLPDDLQAHVLEIEQVVKARVSRGAVTVDVSFSPRKAAQSSGIDVALLEAVNRDLRAAAEKIGLAPPTRIVELAMIPGVLGVPGKKAAIEWAAIEPILLAALEDFLRTRQREGVALGAAMAGPLSDIDGQLRIVEATVPKAVLEHKERFEKRMEGLLQGTGTIPAEDVLREAALHAERTDVTEEIQRLRSHMAAFREALHNELRSGRKLDFLAQEMLRESNTMLSKSQNATLVDCMLRMKLAVDQIREQVQNLE